MYINNTIKEIQISDIRKIYEKMQTYEDTINMSLGEPDIDVPEEVKKSVAYHALNTKIKYSPVGGMLELRKKIADFYNKNFDGNFTSDNVLITVGSTEGIASLMKAVITQGDEVLIPTPSYVGYGALIKMTGGMPVYIDLKENNFILTAEILEKHITNKTKMIILTSPDNPSGMTLNEKEMEKITELLKEKEIYLLSDEIYASIVFEKYTSFGKYSEKLKKQLVIISGFSKSHSMTGYRIGYIITNPELQLQVKKVSQYNVTSTSTLSQYGALTALEKCSNRKEISKIYKKRADYFLSELEAMGFKCLKPGGAFYIFAGYENIKELKNLKSLDFAFDLLDKTGLAIVPGSTFQVEGYVRFSLVHDIPVLEEAVKRLKKYMKEIQNN
ncbi:aminotransferase class I/II-fold pyridoxal phosphate-dependent enzyme [Leptotrichia sp. OH3620_COT-345]|uniref:pyridoxal phosphate-dependent aminotransferase n=1 Tax=Leptotrichia sp. OH3620_COT-345 TaxID=2491048 RepID=UPI000F647E81|nr:aminotransferase class I/II-fold pyridoxal phosphate-dependent enzyme [Leptotrichia sp. OH3620_COT-345]RRD40890.1 aminotransferase class I/II-fold pyridoxal phosphate-dependent enzyme [Leptotrichia sp. OH3620_COT-345]